MAILRDTIIKGKLYVEGGGQTVSTRMISARNRTTSTFVNRFVSGNPMMYIAIGKWK